MSYGIRFQWLAGIHGEGHGPIPVEGQWLKAYDPDGHDGQGDSVWTDDPAEALAFEAPGDALRLWRAVPRSRPVRDDGQPNRPLTACTIAVEAIP